MPIQSMNFLIYFQNSCHIYCLIFTHIIFIYFFFHRIVANFILSFAFKNIMFFCQGELKYRFLLFSMHCICYKFGGPQTSLEIIAWTIVFVQTLVQLAVPFILLRVLYQANICLPWLVRPKPANHLVLVLAHMCIPSCFIIVLPHWVITDFMLQTSLPTNLFLLPLLYEFLKSVSFFLSFLFFLFFFCCRISSLNTFLTWPSGNPAHRQLATLKDHDVSIF